MPNSLGESQTLTENGSLNKLTNGSFTLSIINGTLKLKNGNGNPTLFFPIPAPQPVPGAYCIIRDGIVKIKDPTTNLTLSSFGVQTVGAGAKLVLKSNGNVIIEDSTGAQLWPLNLARAEEAGFEAIRLTREALRQAEQQLDMAERVFSAALRSPSSRRNVSGWQSESDAAEAVLTSKPGDDLSEATPSANGGTPV